LNLQLPAGPDGAIPAGRLDEVFDIDDPGERQRDKVGGYWFGLRQRRGCCSSTSRSTASTRPASATCGRWLTTPPVK
jgi:hypothetical protein